MLIHYNKKILEHPKNEFWCSNLCLSYNNLNFEFGGTDIIFFWGGEWGNYLIF